MEYKISKLPPPVYEEAKEKFKFKIDFSSGLVFAYYPYIHVYSGRLAPDLIVHESVHLERQVLIGVELWWKNYLEDPKFRLKEELLAYKAQYEWVKKNLNGNTHFHNLKFFAESLATIYGLPGMTASLAMRLIQDKGRN